MIRPRGRTSARARGSPSSRKRPDRLDSPPGSIADLPRPCGGPSSRSSAERSLGTVAGRSLPAGRRSGRAAASRDGGADGPPRRSVGGPRRRERGARPPSGKCSGEGSGASYSPAQRGTRWLSRAHPRLYISARRFRSRGTCTRAFAASPLTMKRRGDRVVPRRENAPVPGCGARTATPAPIDPIAIARIRFRSSEETWLAKFTSTHPELVLEAHNLVPLRGRTVMADVEILGASQN